MKISILWRRVFAFGVDSVWISVSAISRTCLSTESSMNRDRLTMATGMAVSISHGGSLTAFPCARPLDNDNDDDDDDEDDDDEDDDDNDADDEE
jgi:hypothetical protein